jgi:hypothetical protein
MARNAGCISPLGSAYWLKRVDCDDFNPDCRV